MPSALAFLRLEATLHFPTWKIASVILNLNVAHAVITSVNEAVRHSPPESELRGEVLGWARVLLSLRADGSRQGQLTSTTLPIYPSPSLSLPIFFPSFLASIFPSLSLIYLSLQQWPASLSPYVSVLFYHLSFFFF